MSEATIITRSKSKQSKETAAQSTQAASSKSSTGMQQDQCSIVSKTNKSLGAASSISSRSTSKKSSKRTTSSRSSTKSAKSRLAVLEAKLKSNAEIEELEMQHAEMRWNEEEEALLRQKQREEEEKQREEEERYRQKQREEEERYRQKQREEEERDRQKQREEEERDRQKQREEEERDRQKELEEEERRRKEDQRQRRFQREQEDLRQQRIREERERRCQRQLQDAKIRAELFETLAELSVEDQSITDPVIPNVVQYPKTVSKSVFVPTLKPDMGLQKSNPVSSNEEKPRNIFVRDNVNVLCPTSSVSNKPSNTCGANFSENDVVIPKTVRSKEPIVQQPFRLTTETQPRVLQYAATQQNPTTSNRSAINNFVVDSTRNLNAPLTHQHQPSTYNQYVGQSAPLDQRFIIQTSPNLSIEPPIFDGNPAQFCGFVDAFDALITYTVPEPKRRLFFLLQYTKGPAHALVQGCQYMPPDEGYFRARELLEQTFGQKFQITKACIDAVTKGPQLNANDKSALIQFSAELNACTSTLAGLNYLDQMDNLDVLTKITKRLPMHWQNSWQIEIDNILHVRKVMPSIKDLASFVTLKTRQITNLDCSWSHSTKHQTYKRRETTMIANATVNEIKKCKLCQNSHYLNQCKQFRKLSVNERQDFVNKAKLCWSCLENGHISKNCSRSNPCRKPGCTAKHTTLLHPSDTPSIQSGSGSAKSDSNRSATASNGFVEVSSDQGNLLPIVPVKVSSPNCTDYLITHAFLDTGSTSSFVTNRLMNKLNVTNPTVVDLTTATLSEVNETRKAKVIPNVMITDLCESNLIKLQPLLSVESLPVDKNDIPSQEDINQFEEFQDLHIPSVEAEIDLLIGNDNRQILQPHEVINSVSGHYAYRTAVGWVVSCPKNNHAQRVCKSFLINAKSAIQHPMCSLCQDVLDSVLDKNAYSVEQKRFLDLVSTSIRHDDNQHYEIPLPLRDEKLRLPSNKVMAEKRAELLKRRFLKNPQFYKDYQAFVGDMISNGYAEEVTKSENEEEGKLWYVPHHGVYHKNKPGKIRVVFDCSAKYQGVCLNDFLLPGPDLTNSLCGVLIRFRREQVALQSDIKGMFHQVHVPNAHRNFLRFLWWKDGQITNELQTYRMCVYLFGTVSSPACANYALKQTAKDHEMEFSKETIDTVNNCFYVDDCLTCAPTVSEAKQLLLELRSLLSKGGFQLTKWTSNKREVLASVPHEECSKEVMKIDLSSDPLPKEHALGLNWNTETDTLGFNVKVDFKPATRRGILSVVSSVYDPLGFGAPVIQPMKVLLRDLCSMKLEWDDPIPKQFQLLWEKWLRELSNLSSFEIPRCYKPIGFGKLTSACIHVFSDASEQSYGCVAYLRLLDENQNVSCSLLMAKTRLTPIKPLTIPRLELCAATIAVRLEILLTKELHLSVELQPSYFWTDSMTVLRYINNETKVFHTFVANRVQLIRTYSDPSQWQYVPSKMNPADDPSRGMTIEDFLLSNRWKHGPEFLWLSPANWPEQQLSSSDLSNDAEVKSKPKQTTCFTLTNHNSHILEKLTTQYSTWHKLLRVYVWIIRFKNCFLQKLISKRANVAQTVITYKRSDPLTIKEISQAETEIIAYIQQKHYPEEIQSLLDQKLLKRSSHLIKLDPILDKGLLRVGGRLKHADLHPHVIHPLILPHSSPVTTLLIRDAHVKLAHAGRQHVQAKLREKYWIIKSNSAIRKLLANCVQCKRLNSKPAQQKMADLPKQRLTPNLPPFSYVAVDFFGPFLTRQGRGKVKRYGVIFTCLTVRAVHIELAYSLEASSFIQSLRRFLSRRGQVKEIRSDNGTNLVGGNRELREGIQAWNKEQINNFLLQRDVAWVFNPPGASHHGGIWERQIRTIRKLLGAICQEQILTDESLMTLLCEVESIINGRPLTPSSDDPNDFEAITPNHLLLLKTSVSLPPGIFQSNDVYSRKQWRQVQYLANIFWSRWIREFLPQLQSRQKWNRTVTNLSINDMVLVCDYSVPRNNWLLGRILEVFPDDSGHVRTARIRTQHSIIVRPITKLVLISAADPENSLETAD